MTVRLACRTAISGLAALLMFSNASAVASVQCGKASWYAMTGRTASGERANPNEMVAAHRTLPFGTKVMVENLRNGRIAIVRINDRGPFVRGRVIDVSKAAAAKLGFVNHGTARVRVSIMDRKSSESGSGCS